MILNSKIDYIMEIIEINIYVKNMKLYELMDSLWSHKTRIQKRKKERAAWKPSSTSMIYDKRIKKGKYLRGSCSW